MAASRNEIASCDSSLKDDMLILLNLFHKNLTNSDDTDNIGENVSEGDNPGSRSEGEGDEAVRGRGGSGQATEQGEGGGRRRFVEGEPRRRGLARLLMPPRGWVDRRRPDASGGGEHIMESI